MRRFADESWAWMGIVAPVVLVVGFLFFQALLANEGPQVICPF